MGKKEDAKEKLLETAIDLLDGKDWIELTFHERDMYQHAKDAGLVYMDDAKTVWRKEVQSSENIGLELKEYTGEPFGGSGLPDRVLQPCESLTMPMIFGLSMDKKILTLVDSVDYYQIENLTKSEAEQLAAHFGEIAAAMVG